MSLKSFFEKEGKLTPGGWIVSVLVGLVVGAGLMYLIDHRSHKEDDELVGGYPAVDLGLSVKWASTNVGAESMFDYGAKMNYEQAREKSWGGAWRMPTYEEWEELYRECTQSSMLAGTVFTGPSGRSVFIPCDSLSYYSYWSSTPGQIEVTGELKDSSIVKSRRVFMMSGISIANGLPIPEAAQMSTRLVCE